MVPQIGRRYYDTVSGMLVTVVAGAQPYRCVTVIRSVACQDSCCCWTAVVSTRSLRNIFGY